MTSSSKSRESNVQENLFNRHGSLKELDFIEGFNESFLVA